ncbi:MAG: adenylyltransferase/cytidyltransferase family protein, partial [Bdellovibrionales bacterium]
MKTVVLFGGSFNPPHVGHFEMAKYIYQTLSIDEVWFLFSHNVDKDPSIYAPLEHRMAMGEILNEQYRDYPFVMS